jgi:hypothetical protein
MLSNHANPFSGSHPRPEDGRFIKWLIIILLLLGYFSHLAFANQESLTTGPYTVSFDIGLKRNDYNISVEKPVQSEELSGATKNQYKIQILNSSGPDFISIYLSSQAAIPILTADQFKQKIDRILANDTGIVDVQTSTRIIDGVMGVAVSEGIILEGSNTTKAYEAYYLPTFDPRHVTVHISSTYPWEKGTLQLLKTIHVEGPITASTTPISAGAATEGAGGKLTPPTPPSPQASTTGNSLWIQGLTSWTQYVSVPQGANLSLLATSSTGGDGYIIETYPGGSFVKNNYYFQPYNQIGFSADKIGKHTLSFVINGQESNSVVIDVTPPSPQELGLQTPSVGGVAGSDFRGIAQPTYAPPPSTGRAVTSLIGHVLNSQDMISAFGSEPQGPFSALSFWTFYNGMWTQSPSAVNSNQRINTVIRSNQPQDIWALETNPNGITARDHFRIERPGYFMNAFKGDTQGWHSITLQGGNSAVSNTLWFYVW